MLTSILFSGLVLAQSDSQPLSDRATKNLVGFAKVYAAVRHFHPAEAAVKADWYDLAVKGAARVEKAADEKQLVAALREVFKDVAPQVRVGLEGESINGRIEAGTPTAIWEHAGPGQVDLNKNTFYRSTTKVIGDSSAVPSPITVNLGGGARAIVAAGINRGSVVPTPKLGPAPAPTNSRAERLAGAIVTWSTLETFYPYFDVAGKRWKSALTDGLRESAVAKNTGEQMWALRRIVAKLDDGHGAVLPTHGEDYDMYRLPAAVTYVEGKWVIANAAKDVDFKSGDIVVSVDGQPAEARAKFLRESLSAATDSNSRYLVSGWLLAGKSGSQAKVTVQRDGKEHTVTLTRGQQWAPLEVRPEPIAEIKPGIWYVDIQRIDEKAFKEKVNSLADAKAVVWDYRGYPSGVGPSLLFGHIQKEPVVSAKWNVPVFNSPDRSTWKWQESRWQPMAHQEPKFKGKNVFVTDGRAVSYAESCLAIAEHYKLGPIVGEQTAGTNGNICQFSVPGGFTVIFTGMKVIRHDGGVHHGVGIKPTVPAQRTLAGVKAGRDELLEKAIEVAQAP